MSFADEGLLRKIEKANKYDLTFANVDKLLVQMEEMKDKQQKELIKSKKEIARRFLEQGISIEDIIKATDLTRKQVESLHKKK